MATYVIGGIMLALLALADWYVIKNRKHHTYCGGDCDYCCGHGNPEKIDCSGYDLK